MQRTKILAGALLLGTGWAAGAEAQRYPWNDRVQPQVAASVTLDPQSNDFVYRYTVANGPAAEQRINMFRLTLAVAAAAVEAPESWSVMYRAGLPQVLWYADGPLHPAWEPNSDGDVASFASEIEPGGSVAGFTLRSPCAADAVGYLVSGYNHMRTMEEDTLPGVVEPDVDYEGIRGTVLGPGDCDQVLEWGNRRPATDGFMGVVNFVSGATLPAGPVAIQIRFSRSGEQVDRTTFSAAINQQDVTAAFRPNSRGDLVAVFEPGSSAVRQGRNVLLLSVDGIVPGTTRTGTDADRITFTVP
jgi:hypothetical protein